MRVPFRGMKKFFQGVRVCEKGFSEVDVVVSALRLAVGVYKSCRLVEEVLVVGCERFSVGGGKFSASAAGFRDSSSASLALSSLHGQDFKQFKAQSFVTLPLLKRCNSYIQAGWKPSVRSSSASKKFVSKSPSSFNACSIASFRKWCFQYKRQRWPRFRGCFRNVSSIKIVPSVALIGIAQSCG